MSGPSGADRCEPNLTPLLDMVLQLIMFFMLCANFDKFQKNQSVELPKANQAAAPDKSIRMQFLVELTNPEKSRGSKAGPGMGGMSLSVGGEPTPIHSEQDLTFRLGLEAEKHKVGKHADPAVPAHRRPRAAVVLRADKNVQFRQVYRTMLAVQAAGFEDIQLRANRD
jgi:biopolymer transport protein ExbD